eukprot:3709477-Ditylum_brightwellii.AAC.1
MRWRTKRRSDEAIKHHAALSLAHLRPPALPSQHLGFSLCGREFDPHISCQAFHCSHEQGNIAAAVTSMIKN